MLMPCHRFGADRLLAQRMRKSQSGSALNGAEGDAPDLGEATPSPPAPEEEGPRLIVVANRLPVSAGYDSEGKWTLQAWPHEPDGLDVRPLFHSP